MVCVQFHILLIDTQTALQREPVGGGFFLLMLFLAQFVEFCQNGTGEHVLDVDAAGAFGVEEEEELADGGDDVEGVEVFLQVFQLHEGGDEFEDVVLEVLLAEVAISDGVVERDLDTGLEQVHLAHDAVEEGQDVDAAVLVSVEFDERAG